MAQLATISERQLPVKDVGRDSRVLSRTSPFVHSSEEGLAASWHHGQLFSFQSILCGLMRTFY